METATENTQKSYFDVLNLCCSSEVALIERIVYSLRGVKDVSVIVPSKTVIVFHDPLLISASQIARALNQAKLEANIRVSGEVNHRKKWPSPLVIACGVLLALSFLKYVYSPLQWLAVAAVAVGIWPVLKKGFAAVMNLTIDVNILVLTAVAGTLALRDYWESGTIVFLFTVSDWLQSRAYHRATAVMSSLMSIAPQKAILAETGEVIDVAKVNQDMILAVKAGEAIPVDGVVMEGSCEVDEKALTGEAFPVAKEMGSTVWAGTINLNGYITVRASTVAEEFAVAKMAKLVEEAQNKRPKIQRLIDECAKYYTPGVVLISAGLAVVPVVLGFSDLSGWFRLALVVLVSACPCGLILSTPVATFCALSKAATSGLLFKGGDYLEALANIKVVAFDKTGTITRGEFVVSGFESLRDDIATNKLLYWVSSIESKSSHPIAEALINYGRSSSIEPNQEIVKEFLNFTGEGISGRIDGKEIFVGNRKFALRAGCVTAPENRSNSADGRTLGFVYLDGAVIGTFNLFDAVRFGAADAIKDLKKMGITTVMLTGDSKAAAMHAQTELGCALDAVHFELLPEEKARIIEDYKNSQLPTAMVGDGINDAPALATADVGISMGVSGSALATETGHVILMSNDIKKIPDAIKLAKRTRRKVIENIVFTMGTKAVILVLALAGYPIVWLAVLADVLSCLLVILNSMTLLREEQGKSESLSSSKLDIQDKSNGEGCCRPSSASEQSINEAEKKDGSCCSGSIRQRRSSVVQDEKTLSLGSTCCSTSSNEAAVGKRCEPVKIESSSSTCNRTSNKMNCCSGKKSQDMSKESSAGVTTASKKCCGSVTCNEKDSPDIIANVDGNIGQGPCQRCLSSTSTISCQNKDCRDLEGQNGCLKGDDCGLNEGICSGREGKIVKADDSIIEVESSKIECSTSCCSVSGGAQVQLMVEEDPCCNTGKGGNREKDGSCRKGGEESSQVRDRHSAAQYGVQDHAFAENPPIQELTQPLLENTY